MWVQVYKNKLKSMNEKKNILAIFLHKLLSFFLAITKQSADEYYGDLF